MMHAWRGHAYGPPDSLRWEEIADPELRDGQVRIAVKASAVNFPDVLFVAGTYQVKPTPPFIPGFEVSGTVLESRVATLPEGTRVSSTLDGSGGYATHAIGSAHNTTSIPDALPFDDAAALTLTYQTGWFALHRRARLQPGEWLLVHAGAGGVGSAAIQLGRAAGARVIATAGGARKVEACKALGADLAIDYQTQDFVAAVKEATGGRGADVVFDPVGGEVFDKSTKCVAFEGRIVVIGFTSGVFPVARANHVLVKNYGVLGLHWGLYRTQDPPAVRAAQQELFRLHAEGRVKPLISERLPLAQAPQAMAKVASRASIGKLILNP
ncbi:MAG: NADPH:quinone oxidoreductase family protein [Myxococcales bacterium]